MLKAFVNIFKIEDLRKKVIITLGLLIIYRIGAYIPIPGIDSLRLAHLFDNMAKQAGGGLFGLMNLFSGGALRRATIFALGVMPYISVSIILQLLTPVIPKLEQLSKEGATGYRQILQYTRYGTVLLCLLQAYFIALYLENGIGGESVVLFPGWGFRIMTMISLTTGTVFIMWLGEQIQEYGIGNGISLIITAGILSRMPAAVYQLYTLARTGQMRPEIVVFLLVMLFAVVWFVTAITQGQRKIPVQYARKVSGTRVVGGQSSYIPLRVNQASVMPIIFAQSVLLFPATLASFGIRFGVDKVANWLRKGDMTYIVVYTILIIFFTFFYTQIIFRPLDIADNLKKYGGFIPGVRPGRPTAEYLYDVMIKVTTIGSIFLAIIAIMPMLLSRWLNIPYLVSQFFGGTGILIVVGVLLDTIRQVESHLLMRHYDGFLRSGRIRGRRYG